MIAVVVALILAVAAFLAWEKWGKKDKKKKSEAELTQFDVGENAGTIMAGDDSGLYTVSSRIDDPYVEGRPAVGVLPGSGIVKHSVVGPRGNLNTIIVRPTVPGLLSGNTSAAAIGIHLVKSAKKPKNWSGIGNISMATHHRV